MDKPNEVLFKYAFRGHRAPDRSTFLLGDLPSGNLKRLDITSFNVVNPSDHTLEKCFVWFPPGLSRRVKSMVKFEVLKPLQNCNFFFFRIPDRRSKITFSLRGDNQTAVFLSERKIIITVKMVEKSNHLTVGEDAYIGGATLVMQDTTITVGAGGLWSDGVLLQGTDSHGVVDLDTMEVINGGPKYINLKRRVWLGRHSSVLKNVTIEEGSVVASGAVVVKNVPKACAVAGVPAKVIKERISWSRRQKSISETEMEDLIRLRNELDGVAQFCPKPTLVAYEESTEVVIPELPIVSRTVK
ncbi:acetyltransferase-like isoleucine patch superfamily enzyme [Pararhizobium capsulatum DSM 1112]|uniref:Acetyltransferase-like isoleucine patch superfamily enzyme n=1 Tax=Pararhizobium capsulatum DSM 1112 TaxID=1121113 RepID=A0ABU0BZK2_9HYPH|nr:hypothetical protein [Pararhizobium capsulatum]MDQ0322267.1 acetyltransferase-like isoleucine patch superfamily enzyme [Pararhizobium capsulatum DSM 1112]